MESKLIILECYTTRNNLLKDICALWLAAAYPTEDGSPAQQEPEDKDDLISILHTWNDTPVAEGLWESADIAPGVGWANMQDSAETHSQEYDTSRPRYSDYHVSEGEHGPSLSIEGPPS